MGAGGEVDHLRECGQQRVERPLVAAEKAAHDSRVLGPAAAEFIDDRQRRRPRDEQRVIGLGAHAGRAREHVGVALRKDDEVSLAQPDRVVADGMAPGGAAGDEVELDHALRSRHHFRGNLARRRRLDDPGHAQLDVEVHRAAQPDRAQHVRQHVGRHRAGSGRRTREHAVRTREHASPRFGRAARRIGRVRMALTRTSPLA